MSKDWMSVILPMIRKTMPNIIANDIIDVQPMTTLSPYWLNVKNGQGGFSNFALAPNQNECVLYPGEHYAVDVRPKVEEWIKEQPVHMWKYAEETEDCHSAYSRIIVSGQLYNFLALRWA